MHESYPSTQLQIGIHSSRHNSTHIHSTLHHSTPITSTPLISTAFHPHNCTPLHSTHIPFIPLHYTPLYSTSTPFHFTIHHFIPLHPDRSTLHHSSPLTCTSVISNTYNADNIFFSLTMHFWQPSGYESYPKSAKNRSEVFYANNALLAYHHTSPHTICPPVLSPQSHTHTLSHPHIIIGSLLCMRPLVILIVSPSLSVMLTVHFLKPCMPAFGS